MKLVNSNKNFILVSLAAILLVAVLTGNAFADNEISWPRETEDTHFYGIPAGETAQVQTAANVQDFITNSGPSDKKVALGDFLYDSFRGEKAQAKPELLRLILLKD